MGSIVPDYSIVIPVYYNEGCLMPLMRALGEALVQEEPNHFGEVIFVDDGSGDGSVLELLQIQEQFPGIVTVIKLSRNFGQSNAQIAGYHHARGRCVITMSADGQEPPELIHDMLEGFFAENYDIVICARAARKESFYRKITSRLYFYLMGRLAFKNMPKGGFDCWLMSRRAMDVFVRNLDAHSSGQGQVLWMGFRTKILPYARRARLAGVSRWTFGRKLTAFLDGILAYSFAPIRIMALVGCAFALLGFAYAGAILIGKLFLNNPTPAKGWAPLMVVILVLGGFQMIMLGVVGEYLWRTLAQVRRRDLYVIDAVFKSKANAGNDSGVRPGPDIETLLGTTRVIASSGKQEGKD